MTITLALAGDTMFGRGVAHRLLSHGPRSVASTEVRDLAAEADLFLLNLECCISERGRPWPDPGKPFFFRAPPIAAESLTWLGVDLVTLANNHALDFGDEALRDTLKYLGRAGVGAVGAGRDLAHARAPAVFEVRGVRLGVLGVTDHPADFAASPHASGVAFADLRAGVPAWLRETVKRLSHKVDVTVVLPHWGPNMTREPVPHVRDAAHELRSAGATLVAGHSAHVFHGIELGVCYDLGDFVDDYAVHPELRNDLGLLFLVTLDEGGPREMSAVPLALDFCHTRLATGDEHAAIRQRFVASCRKLGTDVTDEDGRLVVRWR